MIGCQSLLRIVAGAALGALLGFGIFSLGEFIGIRGAENGTSWMAILFALNGAIMAKFGWEYWLALGNQAADLVGDESRNDAGADDKQN